MLALGSMPHVPKVSCCPLDDVILTDTLEVSGHGDSTSGQDVCTKLGNGSWALHLATPF